MAGDSPETAYRTFPNDGELRRSPGLDVLPLHEARQGILRSGGASLPAGGLGLVFHGAVARLPTPLGDGFLCVAGNPQTYRLGVQASDSTGLAIRAVDCTAPPMTPPAVDFSRETLIAV